MRIHVSNLGSRVTDESLRVLFATYGTVNSIRIIADTTTGHAKGFVEMQNNNQAVQAITRINGSIVDGCMIGVREDQQKREQEFPA